MQLLIDKHSPVTSQSLTLRPRCSWYDEDIHRAKREKRKIERQYRKSKLTVHKELLCRQRNTLNSLLSSKKSAFMKTKIEESKSNPKKLQSLLKALVGRSNPGNAPQSPEEFVDFFDFKISKIQKEFPKLTDSLTTESTSVPKMNTFRDLSVIEVAKIFNKLPAKHCSLDPVPTWLVKLCSDILAPFLTLFVNCSLRSGSFPDIFKVAIVRPLLKKSNLDPHDCKNFRPVSNLNFMSKFLEKVVLHQVNRHLCTNNLLEPLQSAYRTGCSTETALLKVQNDLLCDINDNKVALLVLLDLSAAFDTVNHSLLLQRLSCTFGIAETVLQWFRSYLDGRRQFVSIGNTNSTSRQLSCGVPQGSILGPVLYSLYTVPLGSVLRQHEVKFHLYADDTQIYSSCSPSNVDSCIRSLEGCVRDVQDWMTHNMLKLNASKTEFIIYGRKEHLREISDKAITLGDSTIKPSQVVRNLGVMLDAELSMTNQVSSICRNCMTSIRQIGQIRSCIDIDSAKLLSVQLVTSRLDYCNSLLFGVPQSEINRLQKIQNTAARIVLRVPRREHISPFLRELHWLPVSSRIEHKIMLLTYHAMNGNPTYLSELVSRHKPTRALRSSDDNLLKPPHHKGLKQRWRGRSFSFSSQKLWNNMPYKLRHIPSVKPFKKNLKSYLF